MKIDSQNETVKNSTTHNLPNGALAVLDSDNKMIAYSRHPETNVYDFVRKDCQRG